MPTITVLIAAHNEEDRIGAALESLYGQTRAPDHIVVVDDRSSDGTAKVAESFNCEVLPTVGNTGRKSGALNYGLKRFLAVLDDNDMVLCMDADTQLAPDFLLVAEKRIAQHDVEMAPVGAVGAIFTGEPPFNMVQSLQRNEYARYQTDLRRRKARAEVISGTGGLFPVSVLRAVTEVRGYVYDVNALTEDFELTLAIKTLGYRTASPKECTLVTELMPTLGTLYHQRLRWQRGALANLNTYRFTKTTTPYILRQMAMYVGVLFPVFFATSITLAIFDGGLPWSWWWTALCSLVIVERVWTVRPAGWRGVALAAAIVPEVLYDFFQHFVFIRAAADEITSAAENWDKTEADGKSHILQGIIRETWTGSAIVLTAALAWGAAILDIQWYVMAVIVLAGVVHSIIRGIQWDPLGEVYGSNGLGRRQREAIRRHGCKEHGPSAGRVYARSNRTNTHKGIESIFSDDSRLCPACA